MSDLRDLYQEVILDHSKNPRNLRVLEDADHRADGHNPLCGDRFTIFIKVRDNRIEDVTFQGNGCAISMASASMMSQVLKGATLDDAEDRFRTFHELLTGKIDSETASARLGKLIVFEGVSRFPVRVKCATLAWHTMHAAVENEQEPATTE